MIRLDRRAVLAGLAALAAGPATAEPAGPGGPAPRPAPKPQPSASRTIRQSALSGGVAFALTEPGTGRLLDGGRAWQPMPPASTMKALTALFALARLGPDHRFRTRVIQAGDTLVLAGGGDPVLSSDDLALLARDLVAAGTRPPAHFAVWGGALPRIAEIAPDQADHLAYNPSLSGMILNFNRVHLGWRPVNGAVRMSLEARGAAHSPRAFTITAEAGDQRDLFAYHAEPGRERWSVARGALGRAGSRWLPVRQPELYAGDVFQTLCRAEGLVLPAPRIVADLPPGSEIAALDSPPLSQLLRDMLNYSTNLTAEVVGLAASGAGGIAASAEAMRLWLEGQGLGQGFALADHSGLSAESRVTAVGMARAITMAEGATALAGLLKPDPLAGEAGRQAAAPHAVAGKTGTLNFVSNLAGVITGAEGRSAGFAILCADLPAHQATRGRELPAGVRQWTKDAKALQRDLLAGWSDRFLQPAAMAD